MLDEISELQCRKDLWKNYRKKSNEAELPGTYYTLDEIASKTKSSPPKLENLINKLRENNFVAGPTAFNPTGFRTNANILEITKCFQSIQ